MATTIKQVEDLPTSYPDLGSPSPLSTAAQALDEDMIWQRLESYIAYRWTSRSVCWIVQGPGPWQPPLTPAVIHTKRVWSGTNEFVEVDLSASPLGGFCLPGEGPYRFTSTVGGSAGDVPAAVLEAFVRLAEYSAQSKGKAGATSENIQAGSITISHRRAAAWLAMAMQNSGAADLLRPFRRAP